MNRYYYTIEFDKDVIGNSQDEADIVIDELIEKIPRRKNSDDPYEFELGYVTIHWYQKEKV